MPPQQRPYLPNVSVSKVAESSTFSIAELSNLLQAVLPLALVAPVHLYDPWLLGMFLSENIWVSEIVIVPSPPTIHNDGWMENDPLGKYRNLKGHISHFNDSRVPGWQDALIPLGALIFSCTALAWLRGVPRRSWREFDIIQYYNNSYTVHRICICIYKYITDIARVKKFVWATTFRFRRFKEARKLWIQVSNIYLFRWVITAIEQQIMSLRKLQFC